MVFFFALVKFFVFYAFFSYQVRVENRVLPGKAPSLHAASGHGQSIKFIVFKSYLSHTRSYAASGVCTVLRMALPLISQHALCLRIRSSG